MDRLDGGRARMLPAGIAAGGALGLVVVMLLLRDEDPRARIRRPR
jgi:hypothetical protein